VSKEKRRRAVGALIRGGGVIPVYAGEKKAEKSAREGRGFVIEWHREE
jgi:hypothetical protein